MLTQNASDRINQPILIRDIVITATTRGAAGAGEYDNKKNESETPSQTIDRLYEATQHIMQKAADDHHKMNCNQGQLSPDKQNNITRVVTNEFFFYTANPLTLEQFEKLMQKINDFAKKQPKNLHLVLGSFAVLNSDGKLINIVPHIESGLDPRINLIVKNNASTSDPKYNERTYVEVDNTQNLAGLEITIDDKKNALSFNNVIQCETAGGLNFILASIFVLIIGVALQKNDCMEN